MYPRCFKCNEIIFGNSTICNVCYLTFYRQFYEASQAPILPPAQSVSRVRTTGPFRAPGAPVVPRQDKRKREVVRVLTEPPVLDEASAVILNYILENYRKQAGM